MEIDTQVAKVLGWTEIEENSGSWRMPDGGTDTFFLPSEFVSHAILALEYLRGHWGLEWEIGSHTGSGEGSLFYCELFAKNEDCNLFFTIADGAGETLQVATCEAILRLPKDDS